MARPMARRLIGHPNIYARREDGRSLTRIAGNSKRIRSHPECRMIVNDAIAGCQGARNDDLEGMAHFSHLPVIA